jgi:hypothetical protein
MEVVVGTRGVKEYFDYVSCFHKVIDGISERPEGRKDILALGLNSTLQIA